MKDTKNDELERSAFENWVKSFSTYDEGDLHMEKFGRYSFDETELCWRAWQARAQLEKD